MGRGCFPSIKLHHLVAFSKPKMISTLMTTWDWTLEVNGELPPRCHSPALGRSEQTPGLQATYGTDINVHIGILMEDHPSSSLVIRSILSKSFHWFKKDPFLRCPGLNTTMFYQWDTNVTLRSAFCYSAQKEAHETGRQSSANRKLYDFRGQTNLEVVSGNHQSWFLFRKPTPNQTSPRQCKYFQSQKH